MALARDLGIDTAQGEMELFSDSGAARGFAAKQGLGRMKHIQCRFLWVPLEVYANRLKLRAVKAECNTADLLAKGLNAGRLRYLMELLGCQRRTSWSKLHRTEYFKSIDSSAPMTKGALAVDNSKGFDGEEADCVEDWSYAEA